MFLATEAVLQLSLLLSLQSVMTWREHVENETDFSVIFVPFSVLSPRVQSVHLAAYSHLFQLYLFFSQTVALWSLLWTLWADKKSADEYVCSDLKPKAYKSVNKISVIWV